MKILHVITSLRTGGAEKLMVDLLPRMNGKAYDVDLLLFDGTKTQFRQDIENAGIKVYDLGVGGGIYSPLKLLRLIPYIRKYDVVHTHNTAPQLFAAICSALFSISMITTEHNTSNRRRAWKWYTPIDRWMYGRYKRVICISDKTELHLRNHVGHITPKICTINNGIDIHKYKIACPIDILKDMMGCRVKLMQVAGFRHQKDQDTTIRSLKLLPEDFHLFLVGDGVRRVELQKLVGELKLNHRVHFLGLRNDIPQLLRSSDVVIMSSHYEGFGLAAVEGMAAGKPVIASDVDGLREVVQGAGILFPQSDAKALAEEIIKLDESPELYRSVADACYERACQYDISKMVEGYTEIYNSIYE